MKQGSTPSVIVEDCEITPIEEEISSFPQPRKENKMLYSSLKLESKQNSNGSEGIINPPFAKASTNLILEEDYNQEYYRFTDKAELELAKETKQRTKGVVEIQPSINSNLRMGSNAYTSPLNPVPANQTSFLNSLINNGSVGPGDASHENVNFQDEKSNEIINKNKYQRGQQNSDSPSLKNTDTFIVSNNQGIASARFAQILPEETFNNYSSRGPPSDRPLLVDIQPAPTLVMVNPTFKSSVQISGLQNQSLLMQTAQYQLQDNTASTTSLSLNQQNTQGAASETRVIANRAIPNAGNGLGGSLTIAITSTSQDSEELKNKKKRGNAKQQPRQANSYQNSLSNTISVNGNQTAGTGIPNSNELQTISNNKQTQDLASPNQLRTNKKQIRAPGTQNQDTFEKSNGSISIMSRGLRNSEGNANSRSRRRDQFGTRIYKGQKRHKVCFADQMQGRDKLTEVHVVESYKKIYKQQMNNEDEDETNCNCCIF